jgi:hypothetical protein
MHLASEQALSRSANKVSSLKVAKIWSSLAASTRLLIALIDVLVLPAESITAVIMPETSASWVPAAYRQ